MILQMAKVYVYLILHKDARIIVKDVLILKRGIFRAVLTALMIYEDKLLKLFAQMALLVIFQYLVANHFVMKT
jgi:hypothetical protein